MRLVWRVGTTCSVSVMATMVFTTPAASQLQDRLRIGEVVEAVRSANPSLRARRLRADAARERIAPAGALPDPTLSLGLMNRPLDGFGTDQPMTMNSVQWTQRFPWPGTRAIARERSSHGAEADAFDALELEATLVARAKGVYYRIAQVDRAIGVVESTRTLLRDFLDVTTARYAVGSGLQQDILQAQVAVAQTTAELSVLRERRVALGARLNALMGRPVGLRVGSADLPDPGASLPSSDTLLARASELRPALQSARKRILAAEAAIAAADRDGYPDLTLTLGYGQRPRFDDFATVMVGLSLPLWTGSRQEPVRREMETMRSVEQAREDDVYAETFARLVESRARAERARSLSDLYRTSVLPQAVAAVESAMSAYRVGRVDYMTLLSNQMTVNRFELELLELAVEYHSAVADIEALTGLQGVER
jgi:cobalt-zinc-cadmium efflux system outer membrane protein